MKLTTTILTLLCGCAHAGTGSPIAKVLQMITDLQSKVIAQGAESQKVYEEFAEFCSDRSRQLGFDIKTAKAEETDLKAIIDKEASKSKTLNAKIEKLADSIAEDDSDLKAAIDVRDKENADFLAEEKELVGLVDMLERAIKVLSKEMEKGESFIQQPSNNVLDIIKLLLQSQAIATSDGEKLTAFLQGASKSDDGAEETSAPDAAAYEGKSGNIISTLQDLLDKANDQLADARKKENASLQNFEMLKQSLSNDLKAASNELEAAKKGMSVCAEKTATAKGDLEVVTKNLNVDTETLADLHKDCLEKATDFETETKDRDAEIAAISKAKQVIIESTGGAENVAYGDESESFVQTKMKSGEASPKLAAVRMIRALARQQRSAALTQLASTVAAADTSDENDPFAKVSGLISDMIAKLEAEAEKEATHKEYCDKELAEANTEKADKDTDLEKIATKMEQMTVESLTLKEEVAKIEKSLSEIVTAQASMDKVRMEEKAIFDKDSGELQRGLDGIKVAIKVLREYYGNSNSDTAGAGNGIIGLLEVCESDIAKSLAEMTAAEEQAASIYKTETNENEIEKGTKEKDVEYKTKEAAKLDKAVTELKADEKDVKAELDGVMKSLAVLKKECTGEVESYEERKKRREAEIAGLKEALATLDGATAFVQEGTRHSTLRGIRPHH